MRRVMMDYNHWAALGVLGEILPWDDNRVELAAEKDGFGLPVAKVTFNLHDNDKKLIEFGKNKVIGADVRGWSTRGRTGSSLRASGWRVPHGK